MQNHRLGILDQNSRGLSGCRIWDGCRSCWGCKRIQRGGRGSSVTRGGPGGTVTREVLEVLYPGEVPEVR